MRLDFVIKVQQFLNSKLAHQNLLLLLMLFRISIVCVACLNPLLCLNMCLYVKVKVVVHSCHVKTAQIISQLFHSIIYLVEYPS